MQPFKIRIPLREYLDNGGELREGMTLYPPSYIFGAPAKTVLDKDSLPKVLEFLSYDIELTVNVVDENDLV